MKVNLGCGQDIRDNYINIDIADLQNDKVKQGDFRNLNIFNIADGSVEEILATNVLEYIKRAELVNTIKHWVEKLAPQGSIYIESLDSQMLGLAMTSLNHNLDVVNKLIFGEDKISKCSMHNLVGTEHLLAQLGLATVTKGYLNDHFYIRASKI